MIFLLSAGSGCQASLDGKKSLPKVEQGVIDLREWSWDQGDIVPLDGEWLFDWLLPSNEDNQRTIIWRSMLEVPGTWGNMRTDEGFQLDDHGYGIYHLTILTVYLER